MRSNKTLLLISFISFSHFLFSQNTVIPDANFEQALISLGYDTGTPDGSVPTANISGINTLHVYGLGIIDLTGIEDFTALAVLSCAENQLTSLDVSKNTALTSLSCTHNQITSLDVSMNTSLTTLYCNNNKLTSLDVSLNMALNSLGCDSNQLTSLDLSQNTALTFLECKYNQISCLNVKNGNNANMNYFDVQNNNLTCIEVDDATWAMANWTNNPDFNLDAGVTYSTNCNYPSGCFSTGIAESTAANNFEVYPNPTNSAITLNNLKLGDELRVYSTLGQEVYSTIITSPTISIDLSQLGEQGMYLVKVNNSSKKVLLL